MNELIKIEPVRAFNVNRNSLSALLIQLITKAYLVAGYKYDAAKIQIIADELPKDLQGRFKNIELPEIAKAFDNGVRGYYGDYMGISVVTCCKWIQGYIDNNEHNEYLANKVKTLAPLLPETTNKTQSEIDSIMRAGIVKCFTDYQTTGIVIDYGSPKIDWLLTKGIVNPSKEDRDEYKRQAREELENNARDKSQSINRIDRIEANKEIDELISMLDDNPKIITLAKNMVLRDWFEEILESGNDIHELIK